MKRKDGANDVRADLKVEARRTNRTGKLFGYSKIKPEADD